MVILVWVNKSTLCTQHPPGWKIGILAVTGSVTFFSWNTHPLSYRMSLEFQKVYSSDFQSHLWVHLWNSVKHFKAATIHSSLAFQGRLTRSLDGINSWFQWIWLSSGSSLELQTFSASMGPWGQCCAAQVHCCFTSTETIRTIRDREPSTDTSTFTQVLSSTGVSVLSCVWGRTAGHSLQFVGLHLFGSWLCVTHTKAVIRCLRDNNKTNQKYQFHNQVWKKHLAAMLLLCMCSNRCVWKLRSFKMISWVVFPSSKRNAHDSLTKQGDGGHY